MCSGRPNLFPRDGNRASALIRTSAPGRLVVWGGRAPGTWLCSSCWDGVAFLVRLCLNGFQHSLLHQGQTCRQCSWSRARGRGAAGHISRPFAAAAARAGLLGRGPGCMQVFFWFLLGVGVDVSTIGAKVETISCFKAERCQTKQTEVERWKAAGGESSAVVCCRSRP